LISFTLLCPQVVNAGNSSSRVEIPLREEGIAFDDDIDPELIELLYRDGLSQNKRPLLENNNEIVPFGGVPIEYFKLGVVHFYQDDPRWGDDIMQPAGETIAEAGCALTSAAIVGHWYRSHGNPGVLNAYLGNYADPLYWNPAGSYYNLKLYSEYPYGDLEIAEPFMLGALRNNMPTIVLLQSPSGNPHWVVVNGYAEWLEMDGSHSHCFYITDPSSYYNRGTLEAYYEKGWQLRVIRLFVPS